MTSSLTRPTHQATYATPIPLHTTCTPISRLSNATGPRSIGTKSALLSTFTDYLQRSFVMSLAKTYGAASYAPYGFFWPLPPHRISSMRQHPTTAYDPCLSGLNITVLNLGCSSFIISFSFSCSASFLKLSFTALCQ
jgi:hypothetical protein